MDKIEQLITRGVANIIPNNNALRIALLSGKKLNIYLGIDPTATAIHLGHAVPLRKLQTFAELGHTVTFLIGDFTALIGDTSDKDTERPTLTTSQIETNFQTYKTQAEKFLDFSKITVRHNSEWLKKLTFEDILKLTRHFSAGEFTSRELIKKRLSDGKHVGLHEFLYPVMQGYDSYILDTDIQIGGTDQTFNMQAGRILQKDLRGKESFVMTNPFLTGTDGRKMSKSWGNAIWLTDEPNDIFGKVMSIPDSLMIEYFTLGTNMELEKISEIERAVTNGENPKNCKKQLAFAIVSELHSREAARSAQETFEKIFERKELPSEAVVTVQINTPDWQISELLVFANLAKSKSDARRLLLGGALKLNNNRIAPESKTVTIAHGDILKVGDKRFVQFIIS